MLTRVLRLVALASFAAAGPSLAAELVPARASDLVALRIASPPVECTLGTQFNTRVLPDGSVVAFVIPPSTCSS
jgi:hypothetical protein